MRQTTQMMVPDGNKLAAAYLRAAPDAIVATDEAGLIVMANRQAETFFGYSRHEFIGQPIEMLVPSRFQPGHHGQRAGYQRNPEPRRMGDANSRVYARHKDGSDMPVEVALSPVVSPDRRGVIAIIRDVSERAEAEQERDRREQLLSALAEIRKATLQETSTDEVLAMILTNACKLLSAEHAFIAIPNHVGGLTYRSMCSKLGPDQSGGDLANSDRIKDVLLQGTPTLVETDSISKSASDNFLPNTPDAGPGIIVPVLSSGSIEGVLVVARRLDESPFNEEELAVASSLASETAVTMELSSARADRRRIFLVEDRERIARDLHDVVIQRLFAAGMSLNSSIGNPEKLRIRATTVIDELDATIDVIRETIFKLRQADFTVSGEIGRLIDRFRTMGRNDLELQTSGPLDSLPDHVRDHLLPTLNELLSNVERHANATAATAVIEIDAYLTLTVTDDGNGVDNDKPHGFGIRNITNRAEHLGGSVEIGSGPDGIGTRVVWSVPLLI